MKKTLMKMFIATALMSFTMTSCSNKQENKVAEQGMPQSKQTQSNATPEQGGIGFEKVASSLGYKTQVGKDYTNPNTVKGGAWHDYLGDYPNVLRSYGPSANNLDSYSITTLIYAAKLLNYNHETNKWERGLADYWKFSDDEKTLWLRINPAVKFSDGISFTVDDVVATYNLLMEDDLTEPMKKAIMKNYKLTKESDNILKVEVANYSWVSWIQFVFNLDILPASYLSKIDPKTYLEKYAKDFMPSLGPYTFDKEKSIDQELIVLKRNPNWWGLMYDEMKNTYNFDTVEYKIIRDDNVAKEYFKKGELDRLVLNAPEDWHGEFKKQDTSFDPLARNLMVKRLMFNGMIKKRIFFIFNSDLKPFDDIRIRKAFCMALNKDIAIEKIMYNDAVKYNSIAALTPYESKNIENYEYSPDRASALLDEAGYNVVDSDGVRKNAEGQRLEFDIHFYTQDINKKLHTLYQEDLKKIGIKINVFETDFPNIIKKLDDKDFNMIRIGQTNISGIPEYDIEYYSHLADEKNTYNWGRLRSKEVDALLDKFLTEKDPQKRYEASWQMDDIISRTYLYLNLWTTPFTSRYITWNKFNVATGYKDLDDFQIKYWSLNKDLNDKLEKAKTDTSIVMDEGDLIYDPFSLKPADFKVNEY